MTTAPVAHRLAVPCILLVDDNRNGLIARRAVLEELGYTVHTSVNGEDGLEAFLAGKFDLVVTDYRMPRMGGAELIEKIREHRPETPIILLSGFIEPLGLSERNTNADVVIAKSAQEVPHLLRSVSRLLNRRAKSGRSALPRKPPASQAGASVPKTRIR
jgi:CheY-like chemotaxis protein